MLIEDHAFQHYFVVAPVIFERKLQHAVKLDAAVGIAVEVGTDVKIHAARPFAGLTASS